MTDLNEESVFSWLKSHPEALTKYLSGPRPPGVLLPPSVGITPVRSGVLDAPILDGSGPILTNTLKGGRRTGCLRVISDSRLQVHPTAREGISRKKSAAELRKLPKYEMLMELVRDIAYDLDVDSLSHKILTNVNVITYADRSSLFLVEGDDKNTLLVSRLFDVTENSTVEESVHSEEEAIKIPFGVGIIGHAAKEGKHINIEDAYADSRFNQAVDKKTGYRTRSILCMPIKNHLGEVIGVAQVMNKSNGQAVFTKDDEEVFSNYLTFCGIGLTNAKLYQRSIWEYRRNQVLLQLAHGLFEEQTSLDRMVERIMMETQELVPCEKCYVMLLDLENKEKVSFSRIYGKCATLKDSQSEAKYIQKLNETKPPNSDLTLAVVETGESLNISGQRDTPVELDEGVRNVLCIPIYSNDEEIIGVAQMANKEKGIPFTRADQESLEMFAAFCGLGIHNVVMYERIFRAMAKQKVVLDVLSYHASAPEEDAIKLCDTSIPSAVSYNLEFFEFDDRHLSDEETVMASVRMFIDCDLLTRFSINKIVLCRWIMTVKKNYRKVTYHNWRHAFNVAQTMFAMMKCGLVENMFTDTEKLSLLVACFCHDLDHRGTNNTFQSKVESPIAQLYSTSTMEHHHFDHSLMILNSEGNNIFQNLSTEEYSEVLKMLEHHILSTDLALYFQKKGKFIDIIQHHVFDWDSNSHRELLRSMLMTACDVAAITKPWEIQKEVAMLVAGEFFEQGDMERNDLKMEPIPMMDRKKKDDLPKMQVGFIDAICAPLYKVLYELHPPFQPLYDGVMNNRCCWQALSEKPQESPRSASITAVKVGDQGQGNNEDCHKLRSVHSDSGHRPIEAWRSSHANRKQSQQDVGSETQPNADNTQSAPKTSETEARSRVRRRRPHCCVM